MSVFDGILPGSDPNQPNTFIQTPDQVARLRALALGLGQEGSSTAPIQSGWQGAANLAKALTGAIGNYKANQQQRQGMQGAASDTSAALGLPPTALAGALGGGQAPQPAQANPAMVSALGGAPNATPPMAVPPAAPSAGAGPLPFADVNADARGMRNNNPGNLESNSWTQTLPGYAGTDGRFAIFNSPAAGQAALDRNLQGYGNKGINTPLAIASTWAPGSEQGNNPNSYGGAIARTLGVGPNDPVNMSDPATRAKIGQAIALVENGPARSGASPAVAAINAATGGAPQAAPGAQAFAPGPSSPAAAGALPPGGPQGAGAFPSGSAAPAPSQAPGAPAQGPFHPNAQALLKVLSDPWATPAQQQIATAMLQAQLPTPPTFGVIGKDIAGTEQYGWINPKTQTVTPASGGGLGGAGGALPTPPGGAPAAPAPGEAAPAPGGAPSPAAGAVGSTGNGMTPQGATYLTGMEAQGGSGAVVARAARAIINGQAPLPEANAATKPIDIAIRDAVFKAAPTFNSSIAAAKNKAVVDFADTSSPQSPGGLMLNLNGALGHAAALSDASRALGADQFNMNHGPNSALNWLGNEMGGKSHQEKLAAYNSNARTFVDEAIKFYQGSGGTEQDRETMLADLSPNAAPDVRDAAIAKYVALLKDKGNVLQEKWGNAAPGGSPYPVIGKQGTAAAATVEGRNPLATPQAAPQASPVATVRSPADVKNLPHGTRFLIPDGSGRIGVAP